MTGTGRGAGEGATPPRRGAPGRRAAFPGWPWPGRAGRGWRAPAGSAAPPPRVSPGRPRDSRGCTSRRASPRCSAAPGLTPPAPRRAPALGSPPLTRTRPSGYATGWLARAQLSAERASRSNLPPRGTPQLGADRDSAVKSGRPSGLEPLTPGATVREGPPYDSNGRSRPSITLGGSLVRPDHRTGAVHSVGP
jgi:hypothetical protein